MATRFRILLASTLLLACGSPSTPVVDAAVVPDAVVTPDAAPPTFVLYAPCETAVDCHGDATAICNEIFPGGMCTVPCTVDTDCGDDACWRGYCRPGCTDGGGECAAWQGACVRDPAQHNRCSPACDSVDPLPTGVIPCNDGLVCSFGQQYCTDPSMLLTGAPNGAPCTATTDCESGICQMETDPMTGQSTGYLDGMCLSLGVHPPDSAFVDGAPSPRSNCPEGSVVLRRDGGSTGDVTLCYPECAADTDCRSGYACLKWDGSTTAPVLTTGVCWPVFCDIPGMACPAGATCVVHGGVSHCERP